MYISIRKRRMIMVVAVCMIVLGFGAAFAVDAFSGTYAAYSAQVGVRELVRYNTYSALEPGLGAMLAEGDYANASGSLVEIVTSSLGEQGIEVAVPDMESIREKVERELKILGEGGYIIVDDDGNISEESKSYISNTVLRIISAYIPEDKDVREIRTESAEYDFSISSLGAVQDLKKQIRDIEDRIGNAIAGTPEDGSEELMQGGGVQELNELKEGLLAVETIVGIMEQDLNRQSVRASDAELTDEAVASELAEQNIRILAQYDSITGIEKRIMELYGEIDGEREENTEGFGVLKENLDTAVATIEALKNQMSEKINDGESSLFAVIDNTTKDLIAYKASMEGVTGSISQSIENLEASMTGTITSNYARLEDELRSTYEQAVSQMAAENLALEQKFNAAGEVLEKQFADADKALSDKLEISNILLSNNISDTDKRLTNALDVADRRLSDEISATGSRLSDAIATADSSLRDLVAGTNEQLEEKLGVSDDTASRLITSILTRDGTMDAAAVERLVGETSQGFARQLTGLRSMLAETQRSLEAAAAGSAESAAEKERILNKIAELLAQIEEAEDAVSGYEEDMRARLRAIDTELLEDISMSHADADARQDMIDASSALLDLQNKQDNYERELKEMYSELIRLSGQISADIGDLGQMLELEAQADSLTRSLEEQSQTLNQSLEEQSQTLTRALEANVESLNGTITRLDERMGEEVSGLSTRLGSVEAETKLITLGSRTIRTSDWTNAGGSYVYRITSDEINRVLSGSYDVQISFQYRQGTSISPQYEITEEAGISYIRILLDSLPVSDIVIEQVIVYYRYNAG